MTASGPRAVAAPAVFPAQSIDITVVSATLGMASTEPLRDITDMAFPLPTPYLAQALIVLAVILLVTKVLLIVRAFGIRIWWGLCVLFLPFGTVIFSVKHWEKVKIPFMIYCTSFVIVFLIGIQTGFKAARNVEAARSNATQQVAQHTPYQQQAVIEFLEEERRMHEQLKGASAKDREAATVIMAVLNTAKADFPEDQWEVAKLNFTRFLDRSDLTRMEKQDYQSTLELVERLQQNMTRSAGLQTESISSPHAIIESRQTTTSSSSAVPVSLNTPKLVETTTTIPTPSPVPQTSYPKSAHSDPSPASRPTRIAVSQAGRYIGADVILVGYDGVEQRGRLVSAANNRLRIEERYTMGTMSITYKTSEIKSLSLAQP